MSSGTSQTRKKTTTAWVVALTAIGSLMAALDTLVVSTSLSTIRLDLGASIERPGVDGQRLQPELRGVADHRRRARRPLRPAPACTRSGWACSPRPRRRRRWPAASGCARRRAGRAGAGAALVLTLGLALLTAAFPPERRGAAIGLFSAVTGIAVAQRPARRRRDRRGHRLAVDLLAQRADRVARDAAGARQIARELRRRHAGSTCPAWRCIGARRLRARLGPGARRLRRLGQRRGPRRARGRLRCWWRLRRLGAARRAPDGADALLPLARFSAGNAAIFFTFASLFGAVFFFAQMLQVGAGLRTARRRPAADAVDRHVHRRGPGRRQPGRPDRRATVMVAGLSLQAAAWCGSR